MNSVPCQPIHRLSSPSRQIRHVGALMGALWRGLGARLRGRNTLPRIHPEQWSSYMLRDIGLRGGSTGEADWRSR